MPTDHGAPDLPDLPEEPIEIAAGPFQLRPWEHRLAPELLTTLRDPEFRRWDLPAPSPESADAHKCIEEWLARWTSGRGCHFAIQEATTGALLGGVGLKGFRESAGGSRGLVLDLPDARRRGVATAAVATVTRWGFGGLGLRRIRLHHAVANLASCAVARRCGYPAEGVARQAHLNPSGGWYDVEVHARLATDPEPTRIE